MNPRTLTLGGTEVARIGLGTNRLIHTAENVELIRRAVAAGIGLVDTAHLYTGGQSEETIGTALSPSPSSCIVATKGGFRPGEGRPEVLRGQIEESLRRLRVDAIELYYLHRVDPETPLEQTLATIKEFRDAGKIRHVGLSEVGIEQIERAREIVPIVAVQNRYNLSERRHETFSLARRETLLPPQAQEAQRASRLVGLVEARLDPAHDPVAEQDRQDVIAELALGLGREDLPAVLGVQNGGGVVIEAEGSKAAEILGAPESRLLLVGDGSARRTVAVVTNRHATAAVAPVLPTRERGGRGVGARQPLTRAAAHLERLLVG